ncbi:NAD(P)H-hydrate dehydratase, partial [Bacteroides heparinolyticus]
YSAVIAPSGKCCFNITGNPGMATGGCGDVLTGVLLALLAQGYEAETAARLGAYVHGLAGDVACRKHGVMGMTAGDVVACLPEAWSSL